MHACYRHLEQVHYRHPFQRLPLDPLPYQICPLHYNGRALYDDLPTLSNASLSSLRDDDLEESGDDSCTRPSYNFSDE